MKVRVRVDGSDDTSVINFCKTYRVSVIVHHELPYGNPHYHFYIDDPMSLSIDSFRARVKRYFNPTRSDYSVKKCDDDKVNEYVQYMFNTKHGNVSRLVQSNNFDNDLLLSLKENAKEISDDYEHRKQQRESVKAGPTIFQIAEEVRDIIDEKYIDTPSVSEYVETTILVLRSHRKCCEPNMLIKIVSTARSFRETGFLVRRVQEYFHEV